MDEACDNSITNRIEEIDGVVCCTVERFGVVDKCSTRRICGLIGCVRSSCELMRSSASIVVRGVFCVVLCVM